MGKHIEAVSEILRTMKEEQRVTAKKITALEAFLLIGKSKEVAKPVIVKSAKPTGKASGRKPWTPKMHSDHRARMKKRWRKAKREGRMHL
jgi:hypothetical protein